MAEGKEKKIDWNKIENDVFLLSATGHNTTGIIPVNVPALKKGEGGISSMFVMSSEEFKKHYVVNLESGDSDNISIKQ